MKRAYTTLAANDVKNAPAFSYSTVKSELAKTGQAFVTPAFIIDRANASSPAVSHVDREPAPGPRAPTCSYGGF